MQKINYNEKIVLEENINELLLINIDDKLNQIHESDCLKINGEIKISGEVETQTGNKEFNHSIDVDIMLSKEQLITNEVNIGIDDFNYKIEDNYIWIDLIMKIEGLKEIEAYFPSQEDQTILEVEDFSNREEAETEIINEEEIKEDYFTNDATNDTNTDENQDEIVNEEVYDETIIENDSNTSKDNKKNYSLLNQIFRNKSIKKETSYLLHVVKEETSYSEIASIYNVDLERLKKANNDEEICKGKLVFIPKN